VGIVRVSKVRPLIPKSNVLPEWINRDVSIRSRGPWDHIGQSRNLGTMRGNRVSSTAQGKLGSRAIYRSYAGPSFMLGDSIPVLNSGPFAPGTTHGTRSRHRPKQRCPSPRIPRIAFGNVLKPVKRADAGTATRSPR